MPKAKLFTLILECAVAGSGCKGQTPASHPNRVPFEIHPEFTTLYLPVEIDGAIPARMMFDTGAGLGSFDLDSTFCASHPLPLWSDGEARIIPGSAGGSAWVEEGSDGYSYWYEKPFRVKFGDTEIDYEGLLVWDSAGYNGHSDYDGLFNIPPTDTHVWELNFQHNYLEIHDQGSFTMPGDCLIADIVPDRPDINITIPMKITTTDGDTLTLRRDFLVDSGMWWDVAIAPPAEELAFFEGKESVPFHFVGTQRVDRHITDAEIFDGFRVDSLRVYTLDDAARLPTSYLVGLNFLKRFNVFIDLKNARIGLQPLRRFQRVARPSMRWYNLDAAKTETGGYLVTNLVNHKRNYYLAAGLKVGDEIIGVGNVALRADMPREEESALWNGNPLVLDIVRAGAPIRITVERDPEDMLGE